MVAGSAFLVGVTGQLPAGELIGSGAAMTSAGAGLLNVSPGLAACRMALL